MGLHGKGALVTGAGSGFGESIAKRFAGDGAHVVVNDIDPEQAERVAGEIREDIDVDRATAAPGDVTDRADMERMVAAAETAGGLDLLILNAGWSHANKPMLEVTEEEFDRCWNVNAKSIWLAAQVAVPRMIAKGGGCILITASTAGLRPRPGLTWYNGTKGAAVILAKSMAGELAPHGIRVNALCPVIGETALLETFMGAPDTPENRAKFVAGIPLGRMSRPSDIANAAAWLASDDAEFITGIALEIDGGRCI